MTNDLDRLAAQAAELDHEAAAAEGLEPPAADEPTAAEPPPADPVREIAGILEALRAIAKARGFARTVAALDDESIKAFAAALAPVMLKYGIAPSSLFGKWKEEALALLCCGPILWAVLQGMRADLEDKAAAAAKPVEPPPPNVSSE
jgi:hypothetical protein